MSMTDEEVEKLSEYLANHEELTIRRNIDSEKREENGWIADKYDIYDLIIESLNKMIDGRKTKGVVSQYAKKMKPFID